MVIEKTDLTKTHPAYYKAQRTPEIVDLEPYYYLSVSGQCAPEDRQFLDAIEMLYAVGYAIKFDYKAQDLDFVVPKMECFWWIEGGVESQEAFEQAPRESWCWKIVIRMPDFVEHLSYFRAIQAVKSKKPEMEEIEQVKYELINEGMSAQVLHLGSYEAESPTISRLFQFIQGQGMKIGGYHHEIYLSDPRRTPVEKLKTIIRYAVTND
ncbi:MAG: GyrI-like domain-containing protein [Bacteroidota bacterium]